MAFFYQPDAVEIGKQLQSQLNAHIYIYTVHDFICAHTCTLQYTCKCHTIPLHYFTFQKTHVTYNYSTLLDLTLYHSYTHPPLLSRSIYYIYILIYLHMLSIDVYWSYSLPSGEPTNSNWTWPFSSWIFPLKMVIFHCYVSSPGGRSYTLHMKRCLTLLIVFSQAFLQQHQRQWRGRKASSSRCWTKLGGVQGRGDFYGKSPFLMGKSTN